MILSTQRATRTEQQFNISIKILCKFSNNLLDGYKALPSVNGQ